MTPAAVGNQDTTAAVFNESGLDLHGIHPPTTTTAQTGFEPPPPTGPAACGKLDSSNRACQILDGHFTEKKATAASRLAATGHVKYWMAIFTEKRAPAASRLAATGLFKSWMAIFTEKKRLRQAG